MLAENQLTTNKTAPVNVLFVGDRAVSGELLERLNNHGYLWDCVSLGEFLSCTQSRRIRGTVIVDAELITPAEGQHFAALFEKLDRQDISILCYQCPPFLKLDHLQLAANIRSLDCEELWARIESNVLFYRRLERDLASKEAHTCQLQLNKDTARQLEMAGRVQRNFLPSRLPDTDTVRWATVFRPAEWVSGDIYDVVRLDEEHIGFYLADAVGHSMPAALLTMFLKHAMVMRQTIGHDYYIFKPWEVITTLNLRMAQQELSGCLFATCFYGLLNIRTMTLEYARAGHPYPILIRDGQLQPLQTRGGLLGVFAEAQFEQQSIQLQPGDKLLVYSDGGEPLIGQNTKDGRFEFSNTFRTICHLPVEAMLNAYNNLAVCHRFNPGEIDDVTAIGMEILKK
ncbi:MAG: SpoIIE family protein phosphatase [Planctomycetales bacterium]|nr:SpoIIE family protein phosphatase [Planctomycetales bacterium]